jgi:hypothetical protein
LFRYLALRITYTVSSHIIQIDISTIVQDPSYQVRRSLNEQAIRTYVDVLRSENKLPPIKVAVVKEKPILIDGWHRVAAMEELGRTSVCAEVIHTTEREAKWLAAKANTEHGVPLKRNEMPNVFKAYVRAGKHRTIDGRYKSYREIGKELSKPHTTIRGWMIKFFRKIANQIGGSDAFKGEGGLQELDPVPALEAQAMGALHEVSVAFRSSDDPDLRGQIIERMKDELAAMEKADNWVSPDF